MNQTSKVEILRLAFFLLLTSMVGSILEKHTRSEHVGVNFVRSDCAFPPCPQLQRQPIGKWAASFDFGPETVELPIVDVNWNQVLPPDFHSAAPINIQEPFDHPDFVFELKHNGFRAIAHVTPERCQLASRRAGSLSLLEFSARGF